MKLYKLLLSSLLLLAVALPTALTSCTKEDPEPDQLNFSGSMTSSLVNLPEFTPYEYENATMRLDWTNDKHTECSLHFGAFDVVVPQMNATIPMPALEISGVQASKNSDGSYTLSADDFAISVDYQGNPMQIKGSVSGTVTCCEANVTLIYLPGSMPMGNVKSVFVGK